MRGLKKILIILFFFSALISEAQIPDALRNLSIYDGSVYITYGHIINVDFVESNYLHGSLMIRKTNIAYLDYNQLIDKVQDTAKREQWDEIHYRKSRNQIKDNASGGRLIIYIERYDLFDANNKMFFVIIRDMKGKKLFEYHLPYRYPDLVTTQKFSNWAYVDIDVPLPDEFLVFVNHKRTEHLSDNKFRIEKRKVTQTP